MKLITTDVNILSLNLNDINNLIDDLIYKSYWDNERGKPETPTQKNNRVKWIVNDFPTYQKLSEEKDTSSLDYISHTASIIGWTNIKTDLQILYNRRTELEKKEKQNELCSTFEELWNKGIEDSKHELNYLTRQIKSVESKLLNTTSKKEKKKLEKELNKLWKRHDEIYSKLGDMQSKARTNQGLTNNYKDTSPDRVELEQKGNLDLNHNFNKNKEEMDKEYENRFKQYLEHISADSGSDV